MFRFKILNPLRELKNVLGLELIRIGAKLLEKRVLQDLISFLERARE